MKPCYELPGFDQVYFEDSFVNGLIEAGDELSFLLDLVLREGHPRYSPPKAGEQYCYRQVKLMVAQPTLVRWERRDFRPTTDAAGEVDYGNIDAMQELNDGSYRLEGDWGIVVIASAPPPIVFS
jgi:hypothetical protein